MHAHNPEAQWSGRRVTGRFPRLAHEHGDLRLALQRLHLATGHHACPPPGHAFFGLIGTLANYFEHELTEHSVQEEETLYQSLATSVSPAEMAALKLEHVTLKLFAVQFKVLATAMLEAPNETSWANLREFAATLATSVKGHLAHEEAVIDGHLPRSH
jgi:hemerythrin-like domain-containing protein